MNVFDGIDGCGIVNVGSELARSRHQERVEQAALDCDLTLLTRGEINRCLSTVDRDEFDRVKSPMGQGAYALRQAQSAQDWPARRI